jgi:hypothetical protein
MNDPQELAKWESWQARFHFSDRDGCRGGAAVQLPSANALSNRLNEARFSDKA